MALLTRREVLAGSVASAVHAQSSSILVHEHVLVDFVGADRIGPGRYDRDEVFRVARPKLEQVKRFGCRRLQECTPNFLGRDPELLARLADSVGIEIWTNTGLYGAADHKFVPEFAKTEGPARLAARWISETKATWKPRFIKTGVNRGPLDELDRKLIRAAAITSRETGLTIASHTGDGRAALEELDIVVSERVKPKKFVWVHAQNEKDPAIHERIAAAGAWVEFDGIGPQSAPWHEQCVRFMASRKLLNRALVSQDSGWYHVGEPGGGEFRDYAYIYTDFLPRLEPSWIHQLMWTNPQAAFG